MNRTYLQVVHLVGQGCLADDDEVPFRIVSGGGSDLARISCSLRHDTAYKPHEVIGRILVGMSTFFSRIQRYQLNRRSLR